MSGLDLLRDEDLQTARETARGWRNKWMALQSAKDVATGGIVRTGETWLSLTLYPTERDAVASAEKELAGIGTTNEATGRKWAAKAYLGAFPDEAP
jgi:hypothetical protein